MITTNGKSDMTFLAALDAPDLKSQPGWWFVFCGSRLLVRLDKDAAEVPRALNLAEFGLRPSGETCLGVLDGVPCFSGRLPEASSAPEGMCFMELRGLFDVLGEEMFALAGRSFQIVHWERNHCFCGRCGSPTEDKADERAKRCPSCGHVEYPSMAPAMIVAIIKNRQILLGRRRGQPADRYSVLAGFVEPGETLEDCVRREVREEVGLDVKQIRYFGSQPWPFPNSLMVGFTAVHAGGEIAIDNREIVDAKWFPADRLPQIPGRITIARQLIDWFVQSYR